jgi:antitoxin VapB
MGAAMKTAKIFKCGNSQALRIPKEFHLKGKEVEIFRHDGNIVIREKNTSLLPAFELLCSLPSDFFPHGRKDTPPEKREDF